LVFIFVSRLNKRKVLYMATGKPVVPKIFGQKTEKRRRLELSCGVAASID